MTSLMRIYEIRLMNTRALLKESKLSRVEFADKIDMTYSLLSQYIGKTPSKNIGYETVRRIEKAFNKPKGYLDQSFSHDLSQNNPKQIVPHGRWIPIKVFSKIGMDGYFYDMGHDEDRYVSSTAGQYAYAVKATGDSMFPAIKNGWFLVCDPDATLYATEYVEVQFKDGRRTIKEFLGITGDILHLLTVNEDERCTLDMEEIDRIVAVVEIIPPSRRMQEIPI